MSANASEMHVIEVRCNASLTRRQALAGLELFVLGFALGLSVRRGRYRELITISPEEVLIERGTTYPQERERFLSDTTRIEIYQFSLRYDLRIFFLKLHGARHEVGAVLVESERRGLARRLRELLQGA